MTQEGLRAILGRKIAEHLGVPLSPAQRAEVGRAEVDLLVPQVQPEVYDLYGLRGTMRDSWLHVVPTFEATNTASYVLDNRWLKYCARVDTVATTNADMEWTGWNLTAQNTTNDFWIVDPYTPRYHRYQEQWSEGSPVWNTTALSHHDRAFEYHLIRPTPATPEQDAEHRARVEAHGERLRVRAERAEALLVEHLNDVQRAEYAAHGQFHIVGSSGRRYCIRHGRMHNVFAVNEAGLEVIEFCGHVGDDVHNADNLLAQKLMIEHDENRFREIANASHLSGEGARAWLGEVARV